MGEYKTKSHFIYENDDEKFSFFQYNNHQGGDIFKFAELYFNMDFATTMKDVLSSCGISNYGNTQEYRKTYTPKPKPDISKSQIRENLVLPPESDNSKKVFAYLTKTRGIDKDLVNYLIKEKLVMQVQTGKDDFKFDNVAFVGYDYKEPEKPKYCSIRSVYSESNFKQDVKNSDKGIGFKIKGKGNKLLVFESPIDAMSHVTLCKLYESPYADNRVATGGLNDKAVEEYLKHNPNIDTIVFCYDNDNDKEINVGQEKSNEMITKYADKGYKTSKQVPKTKDFNEDLLKLKTDGFIIQGETDKLLIFDTPRNAISHTQLCDITNTTCNDTKIANCNNSTEAIDNFLKNNPDVQKIAVCFSNDKQDVAEELAQKYADKGFDVVKQPPIALNYKQDLVNKKKELAPAKEVVTKVKDKQKTKPKDMGR